MSFSGDVFVFRQAACCDMQPKRNPQAADTLKAEPEVRMDRVPHLSTVGQSPPPEGRGELGRSQRSQTLVLQLLAWRWLWYRPHRNTICKKQQGRVKTVLGSDSASVMKESIKWNKTPVSVVWRCFWMSDRAETSGNCSFRSHRTGLGKNYLFQLGINGIKSYRNIKDTSCSAEKTYLRLKQLKLLENKNLNCEFWPKKKKLVRFWLN